MMNNVPAAEKPMATAKYKLVPAYCPWRDDDAQDMYRVVALKSFSDVREGDQGGYVKNASNLSQEGDCWIYDEAVVEDNALVMDDAQVRDSAYVCGDAIVRGNAVVHHRASVRDCAKVYGSALVEDDAVIEDKTHVFGNATIAGEACVCQNASVGGQAIVVDATVTHNAHIGETGIVDPSHPYIVINGIDDVPLTFYRAQQDDSMIYVSYGMLTSPIKEYEQSLHEDIDMKLKILKTIKYIDGLTKAGE